MQNVPLAKKLALVTGASGAIGSAIAVRLARDGASVIVHFNADRDGAAATIDAVRSAGGAAEAVRADLSDREGPAALVAQLDAAFSGRFAGCLDILVNNAGILDFGSIADASDESFDSIFSVNVRAMFQLSREAARRMTKTGWGRIVNIGSVFGERTPAPGLSLYCASKFAVKGFTQAWSRDLGSSGITVNNIAPAVIAGEPVPASGPAFEAMQQHTSVGRFGKPEEIADAVAFLASPASAFVTGATLNVDGGWSA